MERRVLIAIFLSFLVLYGYQAYFVKRAPKPGTAPAGAAGGPPATAPNNPPAAAQPTASQAALTGAAAGEGAAAVVAAAEERDVKVETPYVIAVFTNRGARLKSWRLKKYLDPEKRPLELIAADLAASQPLPFSLRTSSDATTATLNGALYSVSEPGPPAQDGTSTVRFEYRDSSGLRALKEFRLGPSAYTVAVELAVSQNDTRLTPELVWGPGLGDRDSGTGRYAVKPGGLYSVAGKVTRVAAKDVATTPSYEGDFEYAGIEDHYFMSVAVKPGPAKVTYQPLSIPPAAGTKEVARDLLSYSAAPAQNDKPFSFYVGPKDFDTLAAIAPNMVKAINFGMFTMIVVPLLRSLNWINGFVGNYGWSIVALTVLINVILFPLNHKSVVSMRKMQEIQPQMKAIQERYAKLKSTDPAKQKMNQEMMALYRERGVNPASGCVPILLTLPVFLAFYALLTTAIELRGAPFVGWIHDLSLSDPYYVMPVLVVLSQLLMQWMTPQTGADPAQQKMMMIMPLVLIFVFISTPAGALIYWLVGNVWRVGQQSLTNYLIGPPNIRTVRPAAERRVKRVGGGKSEGAARES